MASVTDGRSRGQLILIGALALAVGLVAIALVLNSAIYTHNLASRADAPGDDTITYARDVRVNAGGMVDYANRNFDEYGSPGASGTVVGEYVIGLDNISDELAENSARRAQISSVEHVSGSDVQGVRIVDNDTEFQPADGPPSPARWNVTAETRIRKFRIDVNGSLETEADGDVDSQISGGILGGLSDAFVVEFNNGTTSRFVAVYNNSTSNPTVMVHNGTGVMDTCRVESLPVRIDFTSSSFGREVCPGLSFLDDLAGPYRVEYYYGDSISGEYELIADLPVDNYTVENGTFTDSVDSLNYGAHCDGPTYNNSTGDYPRVEPAVYATDVNVTYETDDVTYRSVQRVAADEPGPPPQVPRVTGLNVTDNNDASANFTVEATVADPNGSDIDVEATLVGEGVTNSTTVTGGSGTANLDLNSTSDSTFTIRVNVTSSGTSDVRTVEQRHKSDNNGTGCPP